ncbi:hypothetical protein BN12_50013 [Nostocoides japonicum T1-X7]|uniref:Uncharacterized protein n=1 Tax=Nostocoides japonicum T1-X7 TaxID=1194083 RepID=A0A077M192_9MICO|nr:hypothetical protein [Tetrasphaera japonica]CCH79586.1 hypothetical protein BN12_50013 [Tetrasphaera japonica T1-X7]
MTVFEPSEFGLPYSTGRTGTTAARITMPVQIDNHSQHGYRPGRLEISVVSAGAEGVPVTGRGIGRNESPEYVLPPQATYQWQVVFAVKDPSHVVVTVDPHVRYTITFAN